MNQNNGRRDGFTLIELLVVVLIIGILVALSAGAVIRYLGTQQKNNTETAISKIQPILQEQWKAVIAQADKESIPATVRAMANGDERIARVIYIKLRLRQEFPMNYHEAVNPPAGLPAIRAYQEEFWRAVPGIRGQLGQPPAVNDPHQNSACLLMALTRARGGRVLSAADLGTSVVRDANGDGLEEILDAWDKPIVLIRFPYRDPTLNPNGMPHPGLQDDVDTQGLLTNRAWLASNGRAEFERWLHPLPPNTGGPQSYKMFPVLVSGGPNKVLGVDPNGGIVGNATDSHDNLYNYNLLKLGARGD